MGVGVLTGLPATVVVGATVIVEGLLLVVIEADTVEVVPPPVPLIPTQTS